MTQYQKDAANKVLAELIKKVKPDSEEYKALIKVTIILHKQDVD